MAKARHAAGFPTYFAPSPVLSRIKDVAVPIISKNESPKILNTVHNIVHTPVPSFAPAASARAPLFGSLRRITGSSPDITSDSLANGPVTNVTSPVGVFVSPPPLPSALFTSVSPEADVRPEKSSVGIFYRQHSLSLPKLDAHTSPVVASTLLISYIRCIRCGLSQSANFTTPLAMAVCSFHPALCDSPGILTSCFYITRLLCETWTLTTPVFSEQAIYFMVRSGVFVISSIIALQIHHALVCHYMCS